jgi:hypothetical protein
MGDGIIALVLDVATLPRSLLSAAYIKYPKQPAHEVPVAA